MYILALISLVLPRLALKCRQIANLNFSWIMLVSRCPDDVDHSLKLLPELISYIFIIAYQQTGHRQVIVIALVSRRWHEIAIGTPAIWAFLELSLADSLSHLASIWDIMANRVKGFPALNSTLTIWILYIRAHFPHSPNFKLSNCK
jgi:hypothetical protein